MWWRNGGKFYLLVLHNHNTIRINRDMYLNFFSSIHFIIRGRWRVLQHSFSLMSYFSFLLILLDFSRASTVSLYFRRVWRAFKCECYLGNCCIHRVPTRGYETSPVDVSLICSDSSFMNFVDNFLIVR